MPTLKGTIRVIAGINADDTIKALFIDENDRLVVNQDVRKQLAINGATHIYEIGVIENTSSIVYTVPAGKTFFLTDVYLNINNGSASLQFGYFYVYDVLNALIGGWRVSAGAGQGGNASIQLSVPIEMAVGSYLKLNSPAATCPVSVHYGGLEV